MEICSLHSVCSLNSNSRIFYCQAFYKHQKAKGRFEKSASCSKGSLTQQVSCLFNSSMLLHTLSSILHVSSSAHKSWFFFFRVRCPEMQQKQSSLERQALLLFYGPILLSNVINEHINSTHYINSACVHVNVWGCVWLLVAAIHWAKAFACLWLSLFSHRVVLWCIVFFPSHENDSMNVPMSGS